MRYFDATILNLPFYDDRHRALAAQLDAFVHEYRALPAALATSSPAERGRRFTALLGAAGLLDHAVRAEQPGVRPDLRSVCLVREALAQLDDLADFAFAIQGLASAPIAWFGTPAQRATYLAPCSAGALIGSLALSERHAGSDLASVRCAARRQAGGYEVSGTKTWTSNGDIADFHCVLVATGEGPGALGLSFMLVPTGTPGLHVEPSIPLLAPRAFAGLRFDGCALPECALIGVAGRGFGYAMEILEFYRVSVGAAAIGFCRSAQRASIGWARGRQLFGTSLLELQLTKSKLSDMATYLDAASLLVARAAWELDSGLKRIGKHTSMAKLFATEEAQKVVDDTVQLFGAEGLVAGSVPERLYRQIRALRIYEGTSEVQKLLIAKASASECAATE